MIPMLYKNMFISYIKPFARQLFWYILVQPLGRSLTCVSAFVRRVLSLRDHGLIILKYNITDKYILRWLRLAERVYIEDNLNP